MGDSGTVEDGRDESKELVMDDSATDSDST